MLENNLWYKNVCYKKNAIYIHKLANEYNIVNFKEGSYYYGCDAMQFSLNLYHYLVQVDTDNMCLRLLEENDRWKVKKDGKYHLVLHYKTKEEMLFYNDEWYNLFKFVGEREKKE